uniref:Uncharacterized protein n=1 Tax=viral metagenome TaxID=1070528 RepID=A0A6C0BLH3_9ZZZZ
MEIEVTPCLGIGDLLILKMITLSTGTRVTTIHLSHPLMLGFRAYPEQFEQFLRKFLRMLFPETGVDVVETWQTPNHLNDCPQVTPYIYPALRLQTQPWQPPDSWGRYVVVHTKVRFETREQMNHFEQNQRQMLSDFCSHYQDPQHRTIVILGERVAENCVETKNLGITTVYQEWLRLGDGGSGDEGGYGGTLSPLIDWTQDSLNSGNPEYQQFERDLRLIHHADANIVIGIGGALTMCQACSLNTLCYSGPLKEMWWMLSNYPGMYPEMDDFLTAWKQKIYNYPKSNRRT